MRQGLCLGRPSEPSPAPSSGVSSVATR
jgi:hypothetical protein